MFLMWPGEQITARGIGNGISLIIFVGTSGIARGIGAVLCIWSLWRNQPRRYCWCDCHGCCCDRLCGVHGTRCQVLIHLRRQVGMKVMEGQDPHLPIKVNPAGVIPRFLRHLCFVANNYQHVFW